MVVGGGPAGMKAAITASERGHRVILLEKENMLGGMLQYSEYDEMKQDLRNYKNYLITQVKKHAIEVHLNIDASNEVVQSFDPDEVIVAIGAAAFNPPIKGIENSINVLAAYPNIDKLGNKIVIVGGGIIGCEFAIELGKKGKEVSIIEAGDTLHRQDSVYYNIVLDEFLKEINAQCYTLTQVLEIDKDKVVTLDKEGNEHSILCDNVIIATGLKPKRDEAYSFYDLSCSVHMIGDCVNVGRVRDANEDAYYLASNI